MKPPRDELAPSHRYSVERRARGTKSLSHLHLVLAVDFAFILFTSSELRAPNIPLQVHLGAATMVKVAKLKKNHKSSELTETVSYEVIKETSFSVFYCPAHRKHLNM